VEDAQGEAQLDYTEEEWAEIAGHHPLDPLPSHQVALLHRHYMWAEYAHKWFQRAFQERGHRDRPWEELHYEWAFAMFVWYSMVWSLIEGLRQRQVRIGGAMAADIRRIAEPLNQARNAVFHVGSQEGYHDMRLFEVMNEPESVVLINRVHRGFGRLVLEGLQRKNEQTRDREANATDEQG
jgi:hypothetical protein